MAGSGELFVVGVSWRTAPVSVRERLAFSDGELEQALGELLSSPELREAVVLSTCNRVEIYGASVAEETSSAAAVTRNFLARSRGVSAEGLAEHLYERSGDDAIRHLFSVAGAVDSMVIGESQILGQLKDAYGAAVQAGAAGTLLGRSMDKAFSVAKRVRSETAISRGSANVSTVAVDLAKQVFGELDGKRVLVVGAGKMSALAARHLRGSGATHIYVVNRASERAEQLAAEVDGIARAWSELESLLTEVDVIVSSTGSRQPILTHKKVKSAMKARRWRPLLVVDIAVPRDAETKVGKIDGVYLFDIDDLEKAVAENLRERRKEADQAAVIIESEVAEHRRWLLSQKVVPTIRSLRALYHRIATEEAERCIRSLSKAGPTEIDQAIRRMSTLLVNKLLHAPLSALKSGESDNIEALVDAANRLFALVEEQSGEAADSPALEPVAKSDGGPADAEPSEPAGVSPAQKRGSG